jgi:hypothetical protein
MSSVERVTMMTVLKLASGPILTVIAVVAAVRNLDWLQQKVTALLSSGIGISDHGSIGISPWLSSIVAGLVVGLPALLVALFKAGADTQRRLAESEKRHVQGTRALARTIEHSLIIVRNLYPPDEDPRAHFLEALYTITVDYDGTATVRRNELLHAVGKPLHYFEHTLSAEPEAPGVEHLDELGFSAKVTQGEGDVRWLTTDDKSHTKTVAIFPLPEVHPDESEPRRIETEYRWPKMLLRLLEKGNEDWSWRLRSSGNIELFEFRFFCHPKLGKISCRLVGKRPQTHSLTPIKADAGWDGWLYRVENCPADGFQHLLRLEKA